MNHLFPPGLLCYLWRLQVKCKQSSVFWYKCIHRIKMIINLTCGGALLGEMVENRGVQDCVTDDSSNVGWLIRGGPHLGLFFALTG